MHLFIGVAVSILLYVDFVAYKRHKVSLNLFLRIDQIALSLQCFEVISNWTKTKHWLVRIKVFWLLKGRLFRRARRKENLLLIPVWGLNWLYGFNNGICVRSARRNKYHVALILVFHVVERLQCNLKSLFVLTRSLLKVCFFCLAFARAKRIFKFRLNIFYFCARIPVLRTKKLPLVGLLLGLSYARVFHFGSNPQMSWYFPNSDIRTAKVLRLRLHSEQKIRRGYLFYRRRALSKALQILSFQIREVFRARKTFEQYANQRCEHLRRYCFVERTKLLKIEFGPPIENEVNEALNLLLLVSALLKSFRRHLSIERIASI